VINPIGASSHLEKNKEKNKTLYQGKGIRGELKITNTII
jgi:hypothetical protein